VARVEISDKVLAAAIMGARTVHDVRRIREIAESLHGPVALRAVGDRENNIGTIRLGSDPALGLVERVTNGMDALLDLGKLAHPSDTPTSPREAARLWYGVPSGGVGDMTDSERRALGENLRIWFADSGESKRPTVVVEDQGLGQCAQDFPSTLLSLNENNKVGQPWTMGTYGQGGSVTYGFDRATIIISRRHPEYRNGAPDVVGWTIVEEYETDPALQILPTYKYMVGGDNQVFTLDPSAVPELEYGTRLIHIEYDLQGLQGPFTARPWQFFHSALFDPVLPFLITGERKSEERYGSRIIIGNAARLANPDRARGDLDIAHEDSVRLDLGARYGAVVFNYWVIQRPESSTASSEAAGSYVRADSAVSMTLFGQRQDTESRAWIKDNAKLPFLYKNMVVQIDADGLTPIAKRELFASTRERATKSELRGLIYESLAAALRSDEKLRYLNHEEKERLLRRSTSATSDKIRKRLAKFINTRLKNQARPGKGGLTPGENGKQKHPPGGQSPPRDISDTHLPNVPTKLAFLRRNIKVNQGASGYTWVGIDAKNGYLPAHDDELTLTWVGVDSADMVRLSMRSKLLGGKSRWVFSADGDATPGEYGFRADLLTPHGVLTDETIVTVAVPKPAKPNDPGTEPETGPRVEWVSRDEWDNHSLDERSVGYVTEDEEETVIWVNRHYRLLDAALSGRTVTPEVIDVRTGRYQFPVACALWLQYYDLKSANPKPDEKYQRGELERMAEAVLAAIDPDADVAEEQSEG
jgi:hypothetical protein